MISNGTSNGEVGGGKDRGVNVEEMSAIYPVKLMSRTDKNIVRLIGQHLQDLGLQ